MHNISQNACISLERPIGTQVGPKNNYLTFLCEAWLV